MIKKDFFPFKMKFSIQEEGGEKQIFFTFKEASEKTGIPSKTILRVLKSGADKYFRRSDKKTFCIQAEESSPFIQIDGEDFSAPMEFRRDLEFLERCFSISSRKRKRISWILRRNLMKSLGYRFTWINFWG